MYTTVLYTLGCDLITSHIVLLSHHHDLSTATGQAMLDADKQRENKTDMQAGGQTDRQTEIQASSKKDSQRQTH